MAIRKKRKSEKTSRKRLEDDLDVLWRSVGKENAFCAVCATLPKEEQVNYSKLDAHHIIGRGNHLTRWDLKNRCFLCSSHHTFGKKQAEKNQGGWFLVWDEDYNKDWMGTYRKSDKLYLLEKRKVPFKHWTMDELREIKAELIRFRDNPVSNPYEDSILANL